MIGIIDRSVAKAPSCLKALTVWVDTREEIQFAIDQLDKYHAPWMLKTNGKKVAVFVPGKADKEEQWTPTPLNAG